MTGPEDLEPPELRLLLVLESWDPATDGFPSPTMVAKKLALNEKALQKLEAGVMLKAPDRLMAARDRSLVVRPREVAVLPKDPKSSDIAAKLGWASDKILNSISDADILGASLKDRAYVIDRFLEKRALLRGEPTQILSLEDRRALPELLRAVMREAERRGVSFNTETGTGHVTPAALPEGAP